MGGVLVEKSVKETKAAVEEGEAGVSVGANKLDCCISA